jgi:membrane-associated protein
VPDAGEWAVAAGASPWVLLVLYVAVAADGVLPVIPSESAVIALAALPATTGGPSVWLVGAVAAVGAFTGDQLAYTVGRRTPVRRLRVMRSVRARRALAWAEAALAHRGAAFILGARFIPAGRIAVNMAAGAVRFSRPRFTAIAALAAVLWASYTVLLGVGAGQLLDSHHPLLGVAVGTAGGLLIGAVVDRVLQRVVLRRRPRGSST